MRFRVLNLPTENRELTANSSFEDFKVRFRALCDSKRRCKLERPGFRLGGLHGHSKAIWRL